MEIRFNVDPDTGQPHIYCRGVSEEEVHEVMTSRGEDRASADNSRTKLGQTVAGH